MPESPPSFNSDRPILPVTPQADARARRFEAAVRQERNREYAVIIDNETGVVIGDRITGGRRMIPFTQAQLDSMGGRVLSHNHPDGWRYPADDPRRRGSGFSLNDVRMMVDWQLAEVRAVSPGYLHRLRPAHVADAAFYRAMAQPGACELIQRAIVNAFELADHDLELRVLEARIVPEEATVNLNHEAMIRLVQLWGIEYEREVLA